MLRRDADAERDQGGDERKSCGPPSGIKVEAADEEHRGRPDLKGELKHSRTATPVGRVASPAHGRCPIRIEATKRFRLAENVIIPFDSEATIIAFPVPEYIPSRKNPSYPSIYFSRP